MIGLGVALLMLAQAPAPIGNEPFIRSLSASATPDGFAACLHWSAGTVTMRQSTQGSQDVPGEAEFDAVGRAMGHWEAELKLCGNLVLNEGARSSSRQVGYLANSKANQNLVLFRETLCVSTVALDDPCWAAGTCANDHDCWDHSPGTIALTTTTYDPQTGKLFDADIEANEGSFFFTVADSPPCDPAAVNPDCVAFDVENTFTHEFGHVLGLAHTSNLGSTMNPSAPIGETSKRIIDPGSLGFVCQAYPARLPTPDCLPSTGQIEGTSLSCAAIPHRALAALGLTLAWLLRRRRARIVRGIGAAGRESAHT